MLWQKFEMYGIREKQLNVIRFKYNKMKSRMKTTRKYSDVFQNSLGFALRGGFKPPNFYQCMLMIKTLIYLKIALSLYKYKNKSFYLNNMVCFAGFVHEQLMLNTLYDYAS